MMTKNDKSLPGELFSAELDRVVGGLSIYRTPYGIQMRSRGFVPAASDLLKADRLGQYFPGQENPIPGADNDNLPG
jgi:hypothetical protein